MEDKSEVHDLIDIVQDLEKKRDEEVENLKKVNEELRKKGINLK